VNQIPARQQTPLETSLRFLERMPGEALRAGIFPLLVGCGREPSLSFGGTKFVRLFVVASALRFFALSGTLVYAGIKTEGRH
jgi:hypothetical protein